MSRHETLGDLCELQAEPGMQSRCPDSPPPSPPNDKAPSLSLYPGLDMSGAKRVTSGHPVSSLCCSGLDVEKCYRSS